MGANQMSGRVGLKVQLPVGERASRRLLHFYTIVLWSAQYLDEWTSDHQHLGQPTVGDRMLTYLEGVQHSWLQHSTISAAHTGEVYSTAAPHRPVIHAHKDGHESINREAGQEIKRTRSQSSLYCAAAFIRWATRK